MKPFGSCGRQKYTAVSDMGALTGFAVVDSLVFFLRDFVTLDAFVFFALGMERRRFTLGPLMEEEVKDDGPPTGKLEGQEYAMYCNPASTRSP